MEHLLDPGQEPAIVVRYYHPKPDSLGKIKSVDHYWSLFDALIGDGRPSTKAELTSRWTKLSSGGNIFGICNAILTRLYFHLLDDVSGVTFEEEDFTRYDQNGRLVLTTENLETFLNSLRRQMISERDLLGRSTTHNRIHAALKPASQLMKHMSEFLTWSYRKLPVRKARPTKEEPLGKTHFACVVLHSALCHLLRRSSGHRSSGEGLSLAIMISSVNQSPWLNQRLKRSGWCPRTIHQLGNSIETKAYAFTLKAAGIHPWNHSSCSNWVCNANNTPAVDSPENLTHGCGIKHVIDGCDCPIVDAPSPQIVECLEQGHVPVLHIQVNHDHQPSLATLHVRCFSSAEEYVALSHVWADGLGSAYSNTITQCQLLRLHQYLRELTTFGEQRLLNIWADILCIPVDPQHLHLRNKAIQNMRQVYKDAHAVLVLDRDFLVMESKPSMKEFGMRLYISAWSSRMWTYQEGALNSRVFFATAYGLLDAGALFKDALGNNGPQYKAERYWTLNRMALRVVRDTLKRLSTNRHETASEDEQASKAAGNSLSIDNSRIASCLTACNDRTTSRADDEAIVIGSYLDLDMSSILLSTGEARMAALTNALPTIPLEILFASGPRLTLPGVHWAPRSFTAANGTRFAGHAVQRPRNADAAVVETRNVLKLDHDSRGLWASLSALRLKQLFKTSEGVFAFRAGNQTCILSPYDINVQMSQVLLEGNEYITLTDFRLTDSAFTKVGSGIVFQVLGETKDPTYGVTLRLRYCFLGILSPMSALHEEDPLENHDEQTGEDLEMYTADVLEPRWYLLD